MPNPNEPMPAYAARLARDFGADAPDPVTLDRIGVLTRETNALRSEAIRRVAPADVLDAVRLMSADQRRDLAELLGIPLRSELLWLADAKGNAVAPALRTG